MSQKPPPNPIFDNAPAGDKDPLLPNSIGRASEQERIVAVRNLLKERLGHRGRAEQFMPYLLLRSLAGDHGDRPITAAYWESPDIWTAEGDPSASPIVPVDHGGKVTAGQPATVYAHVWNLGRAPILGVKVEFYWTNPSWRIAANAGHLIGIARVDLMPRSSTSCHKLVKCPTAWVPIVENNGHECLFVRVSAIGDNISASHSWSPWADRHVAQRNVTVLPAGQSLKRLLASLEVSQSKEANRVQVVQLGPEEAQVAIKLVAPDRAPDEAVHTRVLAELDPPRISGPLLELFRQLPPPGRGQAHVIRIIELQLEQVVGGYTLVIEGDGG